LGQWHGEVRWVARGGAQPINAALGPLVAAAVPSPYLRDCFNVNEHWAEDVSEDIARRISPLFDVQYADLPPTVADFVHRDLNND
jgi:hypothetical protein